MPRIALKLPLSMLFSLFLIFLSWFFIVTCHSGFVSATASNRYSTWIGKRSGLDRTVEAIFINYDYSSKRVWDAGPDPEFSPQFI